MKRLQTTFGKLLMICALLLSMLLSSCMVPANDPLKNGTSEQDSGVAEPNGYTVSVLDFAGQPIPDVTVKLTQNGNMVVMNRVDGTGVAKFGIQTGEYDVELDFSLSDEGDIYVYDLKGIKLSEQTPAQTVTLYKQILDREQWFYNEQEYSAGKVSDGGYRVELTAGKRNYFIFRPTRAGVYEISYLCNTQMTIGAYGMPILMYENSIHEVVDGAFTMEIKQSYIGETAASTTPTLIGLDVPESGAENCILTIRYVREFTREEDDIWINITSTATDMKPFTPPTGTMNDLDLTDKTLKLVKSDADGYYHLNTADGPVVYMRITAKTSSDYLGGGSLEGVGSTLFGAKIYDENGEYLRRESYNGVIADYVAYCTQYNEAKGICPLTDDLVRMMQVAGGARGWYDSSNAYNYLFGEVRGLVAENAWMFLCCYYV